VALVRTDVSEERTAPIIRVVSIVELGIILVVTSSRTFLCSVLRLLVTANITPSSTILVTLMVVIRSSETSVRGVTSQKVILSKFLDGASIRADTFRQYALHLIVRSPVCTAVTMTNAVFWDVTSCGFIKNRRFGRT
jgi:hypothetical protein